MTAPTIKLAFVGAGQVNFGGGEGPWNHVKRLEHMVTADSYDIECVGICDPMLAVAQNVLEVRRSNPDQRLKKMFGCHYSPLCLYWRSPSLSWLHHEAF
jgi:predicted dehydrogenase